MKKVLRYYLFLEKPLIFILLAILLTVSILILTLTAISLSEAIQSTVHYYEVRDSHKANCLANIPSDHIIIWKDETIMGFGPDGSYGCFLIEKEDE